VHDHSNYSREGLLFVTEIEDFKCEINPYMRRNIIKQYIPFNLII